MKLQAKYFALLSLVFIFLYSCTHSESINLTKHEFSKRPKLIVWMQIAGVTEEQMGLLRFGTADLNNRTSFERSSCVGKSWIYNSFELKPNQRNSFISQVVGKKNTNSQCSDYSNAPIWNSLSQIGYDSVVLEVGQKESDSFDQVKMCPEESTKFLSSTALLKMSKAPSGTSAYYHFQDERFDLLPGKIYYDRSCSENGCFASALRNVESLYDKLSKRRGGHLLIIRDSSYLSALRSKKLAQAMEILSEYEKIFQFFSDQMTLIPETLLLLTTAEPMIVNLPNQGPEWENIEKQSSKILTMNSSLLGLVLAKGAGAENFCGIYDEDEIFMRLLWGPEHGRIGIDFWNYF